MRWTGCPGAGQDAVPGPGQPWPRVSRLHRGSQGEDALPVRQDPGGQPAPGVSDGLRHVLPSEHEPGGAGAPGEGAGGGQTAGQAAGPEQVGPGGGRSR